MTGMTNYTGTNVANALTGKATFPAVGTVYAGLYSAAPTDAGGGTEAAYTGYARVAVAAAAWNSPTGSAPVTISNSGTVTFGVCTNSGTAIVEVELAFGLFDALTSGNLLEWDYLGGYNWLPFTCSLASPGVLTAKAHGYSNGDQVVVTAEYGGTLPTGMSAATLGTVASATTDTFTISGVNTSTTGSGMVRKVSQQSIVPGVQPIVNPGSIVASFA